MQHSYMRKRTQIHNRVSKVMEEGNPTKVCEFTTRVGLVLLYQAQERTSFK